MDAFVRSDSCQEPLPLFKEVLPGLVALKVDGLI